MDLKQLQNNLPKENLLTKYKKSLYLFFSQCILVILIREGVKKTLYVVADMSVNGGVGLTTCPQLNRCFFKIGEKDTECSEIFFLDLKQLQKKFTNREFIDKI